MSATTSPNPFETGYKSAEWARKVVRGLGLTSSAAHLLLLLLASYADKRGECWPSMERELCPSMGMGARRIRQLARDLEAAGVLEVEHTPRQRNGRRGKNVYRLLATGGTLEPVTGGSLEP